MLEFKTKLLAQRTNFMVVARMLDITFMSHTLHSTTTDQKFNCSRTHGFCVSITPILTVDVKEFLWLLAVHIPSNDLLYYSNGMLLNRVRIFPQ